MSVSPELNLGPESGMFLLEGIVKELHVSEGRENLLRQIDKHYKQTSVLTGVGAAVGDLFGQAANAAMLAMYDGEDTQNFACLIGNQVVCGQFAGAQLLKEGNRVRLAASRSGEVVVARGILDEQQGLVWVGHPWGDGAEMNANWKLAFWGFVFASICWALSYYFVKEHVGFIKYQALGMVGAAVLTGGLALWANKDMQTLAKPSTEVFRLLGFARPEKVNLNNYQLSLVESRKRSKLVASKVRELKEGTFTLPPRPAILDVSSERIRNTHDYKQAIEDGKLSMIS